MRLHVFALAGLLSASLLACGCSGGVPIATCVPIETTSQISMAAPMTAQSGDATQCLSGPRDDETSSAVAMGGASCFALLGSKAAGACVCPADQGLMDATEAHKKAATGFTDAMGARVDASCVCEIKQITNELAFAAAFKACTNDAKDPLLDADGKAVNGFCYLDPNAAGTNVSLLSDRGCKGDLPWGIRFVGRPATRLADDLSVSLVCTSNNCAPQPL